MKKIISLFAAGSMIMAVFATMASAHVVVYPKQTVQGSYEKFTVRVPTEKDVATVKVEVKIPADADISRVEPKPDWSYEFTKDDTGKITSVIWTAVGDGLSATEFGDFNMQGKVGDNAVSLQWKAYQTYKDESVVEWIGAAGSDAPASVTEVTAKAAQSDAPAAGSDNNSNIPLILSIAAFVVALLALTISLLKKQVVKNK